VQRDQDATGRHPSTRKQALPLNPQLKIMGSPWSPPGWIKDSGSMIGGSLLPGR
jgi:O-glycosyl hydrolase